MLCECYSTLSKRWHSAWQWSKRIQSDLHSLNSFIQEKRSTRNIHIFIWAYIRIETVINPSLKSSSWLFFVSCWRKSEIRSKHLIFNIYFFKFVNHQKLRYSGFLRIHPFYKKKFTLGFSQKYRIMFYEINTIWRTIIVMKFEFLRSNFLA
jgi:hypothetical protein